MHCKVEPNRLNQLNLFHKYAKLKIILRILIADNCTRSIKLISKGNSLNFFQQTILTAQFSQAMKVYRCLQYHAKETLLTGSFIKYHETFS